MTNIEYYSVTLNITSDDELERVLFIARNIPSYHRIYIDDIEFVPFIDEMTYEVEILFANEHDATLFHLKL